MLRAVLGVALAAALVGAVAPALEDARATRTERLAARELGRVESAAEALVREEAPGARRTLELSLPRGSRTAVPPSFVSLGGLPDDARREGVSDTADGDVLAYRVAGRPVTVRRVGVDLRIARGRAVADADSRALVFRRGGSYRVTLRLVRIQRKPVVVVSARRAAVDGGGNDL